MKDADGFERLDLGRPARPDPDPARPDGDALPPFAADAPADPAEPGPASPPSAVKRWWFLVAAALVLGVVVGVVVDDARDSLTADAAIRLIVGPVEVTMVSQGPDQAQELTINLFNGGPEPVDVATITVDGWLSADDEPLTETIEPGTWTRAAIIAEPDCDRRPSGQLTVDVVTRGGARSVELTAPREPDTQVGAWAYVCEPTVAAISAGVADVQSRGTDDLVMTATFIQSSVPVIDLLSLDSGTPGFALETPVLPIPLRAGVPGELTLTWSVEACAYAVELSEASINAVGTADGATEAQIRVDVDNRMLVELARLAERACET